MPVAMLANDLWMPIVQSRSNFNRTFDFAICVFQCLKGSNANLKPILIVNYQHMSGSKRLLWKHDAVALIGFFVRSIEQINIKST